MSSTAIWWCAVAGYTLLAIGTARWCFALLYADQVRTLAGRFPSWGPKKVRDEAMWSGLAWWFSIIGGLFWPLVTVWSLLLAPVGRVVFPAFGRWFVGPALRKADGKELTS